MDLPLTELLDRGPVMELRLIGPVIRRIRELAECPEPRL